MTAQLNTFQTFGFRSFINIIQNIITNMTEKTQNNTVKNILDSLVLEIEEGEQELKSFYHYLVSSDNEELEHIDFDGLAINLEENGEKIKNILKILKNKKETSQTKEFYEKLDNFYTALVQCKLELCFLDAEVNNFENRAS